MFPSFIGANLCLCSLIGLFAFDDASLKGLSGGVLVLVWWLLRRSKQGGGINLIGTVNYCFTEYQEGGITTKWVSVFLPLLPLRSYYVPGGTRDSLDAGFLKGGGGTPYVAVPLPGLGFCWKQVMTTYSCSLPIAAVIWWVINW